MNNNQQSAVLTKAIDILVNNNIENAKIDAWMLYEHVFKSTRAEFYMNPMRELDEQKCKNYFELIDRRTKREPVQYIIGSQEFMGLQFRVNENVLIPRQDTEILVEKAIEIINKAKLSTVLDMCTGSGCILISIYKNTNINKAIGIDISDKALSVAVQNAEDNECSKIEFVQSNLFENVTDKFEIIVSNPPYIPTSDVEQLEDEVKIHEPMIALDGLKDGLFFYREISDQAKKYLQVGGYLLYEIGYNQANDIINIMKESGFDEIELLQDYAGLDRVIIGRLGGKGNV
ncbi:MAG: hypothetical protein K0R15_2126 [Clostridiales bacterium]|jgi:release factor glutamine methyltransferase|nr:hypothetical protein [Clostridiales bacterium]